MVLACVQPGLDLGEEEINKIADCKKPDAFASGFKISGGVAGAPSPDLRTIGLAWLICLLSEPLRRM